MGWIFENSTLTVEEVRQELPIEALLPKIQTIIDGHPLGATAYNRSFDFNFLESRGIRFGVKLPCPMKLATPICKLLPLRYGKYKWPKVEEAWAHFFHTSNKRKTWEKIQKCNRLSSFCNEKEIFLPNRYSLGEHCSYIS